MISTKGYNYLLGLFAVTVSLLISSCSKKEEEKANEKTSLEQHATQPGNESEVSVSKTDTANAVSQNQSDGKRLQTVAIVKVEKARLFRELTLPGELLAYQNVPVHAKVEGYIKWIGIDRGSFVKKGQKMITIFCPELDEKYKEGAAKLASAEAAYRQAQSTEDSTKSKLVEAQARLDADQLTFERLQIAAKTPGAVAQNEVDIQQKAAESDRARVESINQEVRGARNLVIAERHNMSASRDVLNSLKAMTAYLTICAPFDGVITERNVHEGSIVAVDAERGTSLPLVRIQEKDILRLVVGVPEASVSGTKIGQKFEFSVPAFLGKKFYGIVARPAYALDNSTRTMPVEMNVYNADGALEPGMFATVRWVVSRPTDSLFVPQSAVDSDLKGTFVIRINSGVVERVPVQRGLTMGDKVELSGALNEGDEIALKATDELKTGTRLAVKIANSDDIKTASRHSSSGGE
jgi:RND family efflux transporter MFP subunit